MPHSLCSICVCWQTVSWRQHLLIWKGAEKDRAENLLQPQHFSLIDERPMGTEQRGRDFTEIRKPLCKHTLWSLISALVLLRNKLTSPEAVPGLCITTLPNPQSYSTYHSNHCRNFEFYIRPQHALTNSSETNLAFLLLLNMMSQSLYHSWECCPEARVRTKIHRDTKLLCNVAGKCCSSVSWPLTARFRPADGQRVKCSGWFLKLKESYYTHFRVFYFDFRLL